GLLDGVAAEVGDGGDLLGVDPDVARFAGAAVAALGAAKTQAVVVPGFRHAAAFSFARMVTMGVSVIIPTLNEEGSLAATRRQRPREIAAADGGSPDPPRDEAGDADRFLVAPRGRAQQMNAGAAQATGDVLLFLHADCTLEAGALPAAERRLRRRDTAAGCF